LLKFCLYLVLPKSQCFDFSAWHSVAEEADILVEPA
jgi:hypothetical protein